MEIPGRGVLEGAALEEYAFAVLEKHQLRAQEALDFRLVEGIVGLVEVACRELGLHVAFVGIPGLAVFAKDAPGCHPFFPYGRRGLALLYGAPVLAVAVEDAFAGDADVLCAVGIEKRMAAPHVEAFEVAVRHGVKVEVGGEDHQGVFGQVQVDSALEDYGAGEPDAGRHLEGAASLGGNRLHGFRKGFSVQGLPVPFSAEVLYACALAAGKEESHGGYGCEFEKKFHVSGTKIEIFN